MVTKHRISACVYLGKRNRIFILGIKIKTIQEHVCLRNNENIKNEIEVCLSTSMKLLKLIAKHLKALEALYKCLSLDYIRLIYLCKWFVWYKELWVNVHLVYRCGM